MSFLTLAATIALPPVVSAPRLVLKATTPCVVNSVHYQDWIEFGLRRYRTLFSASGIDPKTYCIFWPLCPWSDNVQCYWSPDIQGGTWVRNSPVCPFTDLFSLTDRLLMRASRKAQMVTRNTGTASLNRETAGCMSIIAPPGCQHSPTPKLVNPTLLLVPFPPVRTLWSPISSSLLTRLLYKFLHETPNSALSRLGRSTSGSSMDSLDGAPPFGLRELTLNHTATPGATATLPTMFSATSTRILTTESGLSTRAS